MWMLAEVAELADAIVELRRAKAQKHKAATHYRAGFDAGVAEWQTR